MDISVSRLNKRMALQLPPEFPLGLVFVVGEVMNLATAEDGLNAGEFYLSEGGHLLRCRLSERAAAEACLSGGDLIRAGGHLAFEPCKAGYYLLARDVEILNDDRPSQSSLKKIIADNRERTQHMNLFPAEFPPWVEQLAPPEIRAELAEKKSSEEGFAQAAGDVWKLYAGTNVSLAYPEEEPALAGLSDDLIEFLSDAMDGQEEVELTPELLAEYDPNQKPVKLSEQDLEALRELEAALMLTILKEDSLPRAEIGDTKSAKVQEFEDETNGTGMFITEPEVMKPATKAGSPMIDGQDDEPSPASDSIAVEESLPQKSARTQERQGQPTPESVNNPIARPGIKDIQVAGSQGQASIVPWYVVALAIFLLLLIVAVFVIVTLNSTVLPLPIPLPG